MKESSYYRKATTVAVFLLTFGSGTVGVCLKDAQCPGDQVCLFKRFQDFKAGKVRIFFGIMYSILHNLLICKLAFGHFYICFTFYEFLTSDSELKILLNKWKGQIWVWNGSLIFYWVCYWIFFCCKKVKEGICGCPVNHIIWKWRCLPLLENFGDSCSVSHQCPQDLYCDPLSRICTCPLHQENCLETTTISTTTMAGIVVTDQEMESVPDHHKEILKTLIADMNKTFHETLKNRSESTINQHYESWTKDQVHTVVYIGLAFIANPKHYNFFPIKLQFSSKILHFSPKIYNFSREIYNFPLISTIFP